MFVQSSDGLRGALTCEDWAFPGFSCFSPISLHRTFRMATEREDKRRCSAFALVTRFAIAAVSGWHNRRQTNRCGEKNILTAFMSVSKMTLFFLSSDKVQQSLNLIAVLRRTMQLMTSVAFVMLLNCSNLYHLSKVEPKWIGFFYCSKGAENVDYAENKRDAIELLETLLEYLKSDDVQVAERNLHINNGIVMTGVDDKGYAIHETTGIVNYSLDFELHVKRG